MISTDNEYGYFNYPFVDEASKLIIWYSTHRYPVSLIIINEFYLNIFKK